MLRTQSLCMGDGRGEPQVQVRHAILPFLVYREDEMQDRVEFKTRRCSLPQFPASTGLNEWLDMLMQSDQQSQGDSDMSSSLYMRNPKPREWQGLPLVTQQVRRSKVKTRSCTFKSNTKLRPVVGMESRVTKRTVAKPGQVAMKVRIQVPPTLQRLVPVPSTWVQYQGEEFLPEDLLESQISRSFDIP